MQLKINNRIVRVGGRRAIINENKPLNFIVEGDVFPKITSSVAEFVIRSSTPNKMTVNLGDGTTRTWEFTWVGGNAQYYRILFRNSLPEMFHTYTDGNTGQRNISITFDNPENITHIQSTFQHFYGAFPRNIYTLKSLNLLYIRNSFLTSFPNVFNQLENLRTLRLWNIGTAISERIPTTILQSSITNLDISQSVNLQDVFASNLYLLCELLGDKLTTLNINDTNLHTLPPNFYKMTSLDSLHIAGVISETMPEEVNTLPQLKFLKLANQRGGMKYIGSFSNLVNLETLDCEVGYGLEQFIPDDFENCIKIKTMDYEGVFRHSQTRVDRFVDEIYEHITTYASMLSGNTPFRQMAISISYTDDVNGFYYSPPPSGTYQQPANYIQGVDNGNPANQLEKVWVLVNQYEHTWIYE